MSGQRKSSENKKPAATSEEPDIIEISDSEDDNDSGSESESGTESEDAYVSSDGGDYDDEETSDHIIDDTNHRDEENTDSDSGDAVEEIYNHEEESDSEFEGEVEDEEENVDEEESDYQLDEDEEEDEESEDEVNNSQILPASIPDPFVIDSDQESTDSNSSLPNANDLIEAFEKLKISLSGMHSDMADTVNNLTRNVFTGIIGEWRNVFALFEETVKAEPADGENFEPISNLEAITVRMNKITENLDLLPAIIPAALTGYDAATKAEIKEEKGLIPVAGIWIKKGPLCNCPLGPDHKHDNHD